MWFRKKEPERRTPPEGLGVEDIATEPSICTGETIIGFRDPKTKTLAQAVVVRSPADLRAFYAAYGYEPPKGPDE